MISPFVLLDDARPGHERTLRFSHPAKVIVAHQPGEIPDAFRAIEAALAGGRYVAGCMSYELGYALEPRLSPLLPPKRQVPLFWFGVFDAPDEPARADLQPSGRAYAGPLRHEWDRRAYDQRFRLIHDYIEAGDIYQANLSFRSSFAFAGDPLALYLELRDRTTAPHGAYIDDGTSQILSLSPELFFTVSREGKITARPMKGTAPRGSDALSDARARTALLTSPKERAENLMIVDLLRNDLGRLALVGSVTVPELFSVETYPTLHTMVSTVTAQLEPATRAEAIVRALFPCGSVTGAPKIRAMEIIHEVEASLRGTYCGAIGHFAPDGRASFNVAIRTLAIKGSSGVLGTGGAVVQDSSAEAEYEECLLKARYFEGSRRPIGLIETLRHEGAFVRLERHLDRMSASAGFLNLPFNRNDAVAALNRAVRGATTPLRVRLSLDEAGVFLGATAPVGPSPSQWRYAISPFGVNSGDQFLRHKTSWREFFDDGLARLSGPTGCDEVLFLNERGELTEGGRTNIFVRRNGGLVTPPLSSGVLNGVLRSELIDQGRCTECVLTVDDLSGEVFLGNSLRGLIPAQRVEAKALSHGA